MNRFNGCWLLVSAELRHPGGLSRKILGENPSGLLLYSEKFTVAVQMHHSTRDNFFKNDQLSGTGDEIKSAFESYFAYYGTYDVDESCQTVSHHLKGSLFPNQVNTTARRFYEFGNGDRTLTLKTDLIKLDGNQFVGVLVWSKV